MKTQFALRVSTTQTKLKDSVAFLFVTLCLTALVTGCGSGRNFLPTTTGSTTPSVAAGNITGNWQASTTPTAGQTLGTLTGSIDQSGGVTASGQFTTGVLRASSTCFSASPSIPVQGFVDVTSVTLNSFAVNQQYLVLTATLSASGALQTGTYAVHGGCGDGSAGTFTATRYSAFTGTYSGSLGLQGTTSRSVSLTTVQAPGGNGEGNFDLSGTATFTGFSCFTHGTIQSASVISGSAFKLILSTDDPQGGQVTIAGAINTSAQQVMLSMYSINGGACNGQTGFGTLATD